jgi:hypothetical protein
MQYSREKNYFSNEFWDCNAQNLSANSLVGSVRPNAFLVVDNNRITASDRHFILENPIARGKPIFEFIKYNINSNGNVSIKNTVMNAINYEQITSYQVECKLNNGFKAFS